MKIYHFFLTALFFSLVIGCGEGLDSSSQEDIALGEPYVWLKYPDSERLQKVRFQVIDSNVIVFGEIVLGNTSQIRSGDIVDFDSDTLGPINEDEN